jgi:peptidoglycan/LPS O-acetylase OafA/YrhL
MDEGAGTRATRIAYQPALDGVRALAVAAVLLFHAGVPGFDGGYLGVSVFFTLSGFLITSLLVREVDRTGSIDLGAFYGRRIRRLMPASVLTVASIVLLSIVTDLFVGVDALRAQVFGSLFQVANWVLLAGEGSYQDLLAQTAGAASPLEHFWSLAIEEQFYWVWPVVALALFARARDHGQRVRWMGWITVASMVAAPVIAQVWGPDAAYWATPARLSEILVGAFLAVVLANRGPSDRVAGLALPALGALAVATVLFPASSGPAYDGFLPLVAVASGVLLLGLQAPSPLRQVLSTSPFVAIGKISYGIYLYHWPVFVILDEERTGWDAFSLTVVRFAVTLALAAASYHLVEQPIRRAPRLAFRPTLTGAVAASVVVAVIALLFAPSGLGNYWEVDEQAAEAAAIQIDEAPLTLPAVTSAPLPTSTPTTTTTTVATAGRGSSVPDATVAVTDVAPVTSAPVAPAATEAPPPTSTIPPVPELGRPVRVLVTGDSTADALGTGVVSWAAAHPELAQAEVTAALGCGFLLGGEIGTAEAPSSFDSCAGWVDAQVLPAVERTQPDVVVAMVTAWDIIDRRWDDGEMLSPDDAEFRSRLDAAYAQLVDDLLAAGAARVAFVREPVPDVWWLEKVNDEDRRERHEVLYEVFDQLAAARPDIVTVIDLDGWFVERGFETDRDVRPDGIHLDPEAATMITDEFLGDRILRAALGMAQP